MEAICGRRIGMPTSKRKNANPSAAASVAATAFEGMERVIVGMRVAGVPEERTLKRTSGHGS